MAGNMTVAREDLRGVMYVGRNCHKKMFVRGNLQGDHPYYYITHYLDCSGIAHWYQVPKEASMLYPLGVILNKSQTSRTPPYTRAVH